MRAGNLRNKVIIQKLGTTRNEFNEVEEGDYETFKTVWCSITPISGRESFLSNKDFSETTHKIKTRYISGVNASMRLLWGSRTFKFLNTRDIGERTKTIEILAKEDNNG